MRYSRYFKDAIFFALFLFFPKATTYFSSFIYKEISNKLNYLKISLLTFYSLSSFQKHQT